jgi:hypothetical protein
MLHTVIISPGFFIFSTIFLCSDISDFYSVIMFVFPILATLLCSNTDDIKNRSSLIMKELSKELVQAKLSSHNFHFIENHLDDVGGTKMNHSSSSK